MLGANLGLLLYGEVSVTIGNVVLKVVLGGVDLLIGKLVLRAVLTGVDLLIGKLWLRAILGGVDLLIGKLVLRAVLKGVDLLISVLMLTAVLRTGAAPTKLCARTPMVYTTWRTYRQSVYLYCYIKVLKVKPVYQQMTLSPKLGVVGISTLWHFRLPLPIQMFIKVASSPRLSGIGMPSPIL